MPFHCYSGAVSSFLPYVYHAYLVMVTGTDIPGGYAGKGTTDTDTARVFCTWHCIRTHTHHTHTHCAGFVTVTCDENHM